MQVGAVVLSRTDRQRVRGAVAVVVSSVLAQLVSAFQVLGGDDIYILDRGCVEPVRMVVEPPR